MRGVQAIQKSIVEVEDMFVQLTCRILGINESSINGRIRIGWSSNVDEKVMSAPNLKTNEDVCYIRITPEEDAYDRQRHIRYVHEGGENMTAIDEHTDVYSVLFINYGVNACEKAKTIKSGLFRDETRRFLRLNHFALVTNVPAIRRVPELSGGNWINRADVSAVFNQFVRLVGSMKTIEQIGIDTVPDGGEAWPDGHRTGINILQENGHITKTATIRKERENA